MLHEGKSAIECATSLMRLPAAKREIELVKESGQAAQLLKRLAL